MEIRHISHFPASQEILTLLTLRSCTVAVTDETGTLTDSVYVAHETASIRFVSAIESYCANSVPKTNLYALAVHFYKHFILGWE